MVSTCTVFVSAVDLTGNFIDGIFYIRDLISPRSASNISLVSDLSVANIINGVAELNIVQGSKVALCLETENDYYVKTVTIPGTSDLAEDPLIDD